jgi:flagellar biosynthetic protein FlhB
LPGGGQEKTEKATPKKRKDARMKDGNVLKSKDINTVFQVLGIFLILSLVGTYMLRQMMSFYRYFMNYDSLGSEFNVSSEFMTETAIRIIFFVATTVGPVLFAAVLLGTIPTAIQTKGLFTMQPLKPKFSKLNPITGMKKFFSLQSAVNVVKGLVVISIIITIVYNRISALMPEIRTLTQVEPLQGVLFIARNILSIVLTIVILLIFISVLDYIFQWWQFEKKLKMSKQEVKDEYKQIEGDPVIKSRIKQKQREIAQNRMMGEVPTSDVVVRNPTHFAVALRYDPNMIMAAPRVVAKGQDAIALKIIAIAEENDVPVYEDRHLARALHDNVKIGGEIPGALFNVVASIFAELDIMEKKNISFD